MGRFAVPVLLAVLGVYLALVYGQGLRLPFLNDDYLFLDKVRGMDFPDLWKPEGLIFGWYRPWSRELHYWTLVNLAGRREGPFHLVSFALWLATMALYFGFVRQLSGGTAAAIATAGLAGLALWSAPLLWIAGAQDLWMLLFGLLFLHAVVRGWNWAALLFLVLALLSKETAAVLPGVAFAYVWLVERKSPREAFRRTVWFWLALLAWILVHPTLSDRFFGPLRHSAETELRPGPGTTMLKTLLAQVNLEGQLSPEGGWGAILGRGAVGAAILGLLVFALGRPMEKEEASSNGRRADYAVMTFGVLWAILGWGILFLPSIGWHAYYGVLGSLGCWLVIGTALRRHLRIAVALLFIVATLREARAATPSWDWGTFWYQKRAGSFLEAIRYRLLELRPDLPPHSRIFFARVPNNIGLLAGDGPALRIWYDDPTLTAGYYSTYVPRRPGEIDGGDYFFRFDSLQVLVEVESGPQSNRLGTYPGWPRDQQVLASLFIRGGNPRGAAAAYARLWRGMQGRPEYALFAATAYDAAGDSLEAAAHYRMAARALGDSLVREQAVLLVRQARTYQETARRGPPARAGGSSRPPSELDARE
jgi:hypothetical protein